MKSKMVLISFALFGLMIAGQVFGGSLEPSSGPGSTMKTLDEVEPRIPISQSDIPKTINTSGSYYLTEDVTAVGTAITVSADDVTIGLAGFALVGPGSGTNYGININGIRDNIEIRNGTIRGFKYGITQSITACTNTRVIDMRVLANTERGIALIGSGNLVKNCIVSENGTGGGGSYAYGIKVGKNSIVSGNVVSNNGISSTADYVYGIGASEGSTVTGNTVSGNGASSIGSSYIYGISASGGCTVTHNTSYGNGNLAAGSYVIYGISAYLGSTVTGNTTYDNGNSAGCSYIYGISAYSGSTVTHNTSYGNGNSADSFVYGISAGTGNTVIGNTAYDNGDSAVGTVWGIYLSGSNLVDQNTAYDNGTGAGSATNMNSPANCTFGTNHAP